MLVIMSRTTDGRGERGMGIPTTERKSRGFSPDNDCQSVSEVASREYRGWLPRSLDEQLYLSSSPIQKAEEPRRRTYNGKHERRWGAGNRAAREKPSGTRYEEMARSFGNASREKSAAIRMAISIEKKSRRRPRWADFVDVTRKSVSLRVIAEARRIDDVRK